MHRIYTSLLVASLSVFPAISQNTVTLLEHTPRSGVQVLASQPDGTTDLQFTLGKVVLKPVSINGQVYYSVELDDDARIQKRTSPDLPVFTASVIIPDAARMEIEELEGGFQEFHNILVAPSKGSLLRTVNPSTVPYEFGPAYQSDAFFPAAHITLHNPYIFRDYRGQTVAFQPVQYNPVTKTLRVYYTMSVRVKVKDLNGSNKLIRTQNNASVDEEFDHAYRAQFLNYTEATRYTPVSESGRMLIIAHTGFAADMQPFVTWKNQRGLKTELVTTAFTGNTASQIAAYVQNYYAQHPDLKYLLLVGDHAQVPAMAPGQGNNLPGYSDNYYAYLTGNDSYPEIFVGRFSAENVQHVQTQVRRSVQYEKNPDMGSWYSTGIGIGSNEGPGDDNEMDFEHIRNIRGHLLNFTYTYVHEFYDGDQGGLDASGNPTPQMVANAINGGAGIINYTGHGWSGGIASSGFSSNEVPNLTNANRLPFFWSVACVNGEFMAGTCFAEHLLRSVDGQGNPIGAVATLMSTINQSWSEPMEGQDAMNDLLRVANNNNIKRTFGGISMNGCMQMNDSYPWSGSFMTDTWTVFGDPSLLVRTAQPQILTASHTGTLLLGSTQVSVQCNVNDALIALSQNGQLLGTSIVSGGQALVSFNALNSLDTIKVVATAFNYKPYIGNIQVLPAAGPFMICSQNIVRDPQGNNNNLPDFGEAIQLDIDLSNAGLGNAQGVSATLSCSDPYITITNNYAYFGNITAGSNQLLTNAYAFTISPQITDQSTAHFTLNITDNVSNTWTSQFQMVLNAPVLAVQPYYVINDQGGNNNGVLDPGETATITITNVNTGHANTAVATAQLAWNNSGITSPDASQNVGMVQANNQLPVTFTLSVPHNVVPGTAVNFQYDLAAGVHNGQLVFREIIGLARETFETNDFSQHAWSHNGADPWFTTTHNPYQGNYCSQSGAIHDNENTELSVTTLAVAQDSISFYRRVSSEGGYDFLEFGIDGTVLDAWSGVLNWERFAYPVTPGPHTYSWNYVKDYMVGANDDAAWVDFIIFPLALISDPLGNSTFGLFEFSVFPNPTAEQLTLSFTVDDPSGISIRLWDASGKLVRFIQEEQLYPAGTHQVQTNISTLAAGSYIVEFSSGNRKSSRRIVKF